MSERLIFISASQRHDHVAVGQAIAATINATAGFRAFFAEEPTDAAPATDTILAQLHDAAGIVAVFQARESLTVQGTDQKRASVWVHEELAVIMYRLRACRERVPILGLREPEFHIKEGMIGPTLLNPKPFSSPEEACRLVREWLESTGFPHLGPREIFLEKWGSLTPDDKLYLRALVLEGGEDVAPESIKKRVRLLGHKDKATNHFTLTVRGRLHSLTLIAVADETKVLTPISLHGTWARRIRDQLNVEGAQGA